MKQVRVKRYIRRRRPGESSIARVEKFKTVPSEQRVYKVLEEGY